MLVGLICPNGDKVRWDVCLKKECSGCFPLSIRQAIYRFNKELHDWPSVTSLLYCLRKTKLEHDNDYYVKPQDAYYAMRGSLIHELLSSHKPEEGEIIEQGFSREIPGTGLILKGRIDRYKDGVLEDYKTMADNGIHFLKKGEHKEAYIWQTNIYKWLMESKCVVNKIRLIYLTMSNVVTSGENFLVKNTRTREFEEYQSSEIPIYTDEKIEAFLIPKARTLMRKGLPPADPKNPWLCNFCSFKEMCQEKTGDAGAVVTKVNNNTIKSKEETKEKKIINVDELF